MIDFAKEVQLPYLPVLSIPEGMAPLNAWCLGIGLFPDLFLIPY